MKLNIDDYTKKLRELKQQYGSIQESLEEQIPLDNRLLQNCFKDQITMQIELNNFLSDLYYYHESVKTDVEELYSLRYQALIDDSYKGYSATEAKQIAMSDQNYLSLKKVYNQYHSLLVSVNQMNDLLETRKYTLKNLSDSMINGTNKAII